MACRECRQDLPIVNQFHKLCLTCNNIRLHGNKYGKQYDKAVFKIARIKTRNKPSKSLFFTPTPDSKKSEKISFWQNAEKDKVDKIAKDEAFYEKCFNSSDHKCEECGVELPDIFRDENGKVVARWRYSHIIPKSIANELRHNVDNINHLCLQHHKEWENGDKKSMKIYGKNAKKFPNYLT